MNNKTPKLTYDEVTNIILESGISKKVMKKKLIVANKKLAGLIEDKVFIAILVAKELGVPISLPPILSGNGKTSESIKLHRITEEHSKVSTSGAIISIKDGETKSGNPKKSIRITNGKTTMSIAVYDAALDSFIQQKLSIGDQITVVGADVFSFESNTSGETVVMLTAGRFTEIIKDTKSRVVKDYVNAKIGNLTTLSGVVLETDAYAYVGCPHCLKKIPDIEIEDAGEKGKCKSCGKVKTEKIIILHMGVSNGETGVDVVAFPRVGVTEEDVAYQYIKVIGIKKEDNTLSAIQIDITGNTKKRKLHNAYFSEQTDASKKKTFTTNIIKKDIVSFVSLYFDGISIKKLIKTMHIKYTSVKKSEIKVLILELVKANELTKSKTKIYPV